MQQNEYTYYFGKNYHGEVFVRSRREAALNVSMKIFTCRARSIYEAQRIARDTIRMFETWGKNETNQ